MNFKRTWENFKLKNWQLRQIEGPLRLDPKVFEQFLKAPYDILPDFQGPAGSKLKGGRGKDHPRYGRFTYAFAKHYKPNKIVEVGTYAGGTSIGWTKALSENGTGTLYCVDSDVYSKGTYPGVTQKNLERVGASATNVIYHAGDSKSILPDVAKSLTATVDIYLVDGDHTYEGALRDIQNGLPMMKKGGYILVHDVDTTRRMNEQTPQHPHPVHEAFMQVAKESGYPWCILKFVRKHLGVLQIPA